MEILALKLVTGEDILGEIESQSETEFVLVNPVGIAIVRGKDGTPNVGFTPFPIHAEPESGIERVFKDEHIVYQYVPAEDFRTNYDQLFGTGLITPPKKLIVG